MTIKHLVISGGGPTLFKSYSAAQQLEKNGFWKIEDIESIYGTSAGAVVGVLLSLKFDWETVNTYLIDRPWHEACPINIETIMGSYSKKGLFDKNILETFFKPLFSAKDISMDITLEEFYAYSKIKLHIFTFELNEFKDEEITHETHPDLKLLTAIQMSCCMPIIIAPVFYGNKCYVDGGFITNYPLSYCITKCKNTDEILGFRNDYGGTDNYQVTQESNLSEYIMTLLQKVVSSICTEKKQDKIKNEVVYKTVPLSISLLNSVLSNIEVRKELLRSGEESADLFLSLLPLQL